MGLILGREAYLEFMCFGMPDEYPKSTEQAAQELRARGGDASVPALNYLIKQQRVAPVRNGRNYEWHPEHIDQVAQMLDEQAAYTRPFIVFEQLGINSEEFFRSLAKAWDEVRETYGEPATPVNPNQDSFVWTYHPPSWTRDGYVEFTLRDDVRQSLEQEREKTRGIKGFGLTPAEKKRRAKK